MRTALGFARWFLAFDDVQWFLHEGLTADQRKHATRLLLVLLTRAIAAGGLLGAATAIVLTVTASQATGVTPPGVATAPEINVVAREPGPGYNVAAFCNDPSTVVAKPLFSPPEDLGRLIASRGTETVNWPGRNTITAEHAWVDTASGPHSEVVEMTPAAVLCFQKKAR